MVTKKINEDYYYMNFLSSNLFCDNFTEMNLASDLIMSLNNMKISKPTPVQSTTIPNALNGSDLVVVAQTGSGKTLSYILPILMKLKQNPQSRALILAPSREIAEQIFNVFKNILPEQQNQYCLVVAGIPNKTQSSQLRKHPQVLIATPGRLNEHLVTNKLLLQGVETLVIDESDRMLDKVFLSQLSSIRKTMRGQWQTMLFSASLSSTIEQVVLKFMFNSPILIRTKNVETPVPELKQKIIFLNRGMKNDCLASLLKKTNRGVLVFAGDQFACENIGEHLKQNGFNCDFTHGGLSAGHRSRVLKDFRENKIQILITTDLLARGLDVPSVECVVNYDLPNESEDFLHRIGRTARAGQSGQAITFITPTDNDMYNRIKPYLKQATESKLN